MPHLSSALPLDGSCLTCPAAGPMLKLMRQCLNSSPVGCPAADAFPQPSAAVEQQLPGLPAAGSALKPMRQSLDKIPQADRNAVTTASRRPASNTRPLPPISAGSHPGTPSQGRTTLNENDNIKVSAAMSGVPIRMLTALDRVTQPMLQLYRTRRRAKCSCTGVMVSALRLWLGSDAFQGLL